MSVELPHSPPTSLRMSVLIREQVECTLLGGDGKQTDEFRMLGVYVLLVVNFARADLCSQIWDVGSRTLMFPLLLRHHCI